MASFIANARMYAVTPEVEAAWRDLLGRICAAAEVDLAYFPYPAPQPLEDLWRRPDLGAVFMCGYPIAMRLADVQPIAAPIPSAAWAQRRPVYRTHLIVRDDSPYETLADTFGGRLGWTVGHSHSGFNALRYHLLRYRTRERPTLYREVVGSLVTARRVLDAVIADEVDVGPLDAYWHELLIRHRPSLAEKVRVIEATDVAPIPSFVAAPGVAEPSIERLKASFLAASRAPWFAPLGETLLIQGFTPVERADFAPALAWEAEAKAAGYEVPG